MNIIELAREAGAYICTSPMVPDSIPEISFVPQKLERFAHLVRAQTLEESAGVCDERSLADFPQTQTGMGFSFSQQWDAARTAEKQCAAAIRQLKDKT